MNKILSVNIGGMIFQLDEEAFEMLKSYIDSIRLHFSRTEGSHEITSDIESRIAEMLQSKLHAGKQAINKPDVETIIAAMGRPEDFGDAATEEEQASGHYNTSAPTGEPVFRTSRKRLFRDTEKSVIGGVCSGIAAYMGTDPIWIRLIFLLVFFTFGTGLLIYIILWIIMPKAKTITDKLEMRGENITISNIEKSVKEEFGDLKKNFNSLRSSGAGQEIRSRANDFGNLIVQLIRYIFRFVVKFAGVLLIIFGILLLGTLILSYFGLLFPAFTDMPLAFFPERWQHIVTTTAALFFIGIPLLFLVILGFRTVFNIRYNNKTYIYSFLSLWIVSLLTVLVAGGFLIKNYSSVTVKKEKIKLDNMPVDTITLSALEGPEATQDEYTYRFGWGGSMIVSHEEILSRKVHLDIEKSATGEMELVKIVEARGKAFDTSDRTTQQVNYSFQQQEGKLLFNKFYSMKEYKPWRMQDLKLVLRIPVGKVIKLDENMKYFIYDVDNVTDTWAQDMVGHSWQMTDKGLKCLDCDFEEMNKWEKQHHKSGNEQQDEDVDIRFDGKDGEIKIRENTKDGKKKVSIRFSSL